MPQKKSKTTSASLATLKQLTPANALQTQHDLNPGIDFDPKMIANIHVNLSAAERRVKSLKGRRTVKKQWQAAWLVHALKCIDLTTLSGDDSPGRVKRLCAKARNPLRQDILANLDLADENITTGAVCVYHEMVKTAVEALKGTNIPVAAVSTGFPSGLSPFKQRVAEIKESVKAGATEIDIVITRHHVLRQNWKALYKEVKAFKEACGPGVHLKAILATGELATLRNVAKASMVAMMAGSDFIKTSTGKEKINATLEFTLIMARMIRSYYEATGYKVGYKPAGGISTAKDAIAYMVLMKEELGAEWLQPHLFRFGASSLLADIERQLEHHITGAYSAFNRHPIA